MNKIFVLDRIIIVLITYGTRWNVIFQDPLK